ncbi:MAG: homoprotocatechuate degradation operon regulator HpaR [Burkholderiaceae bacterium]
MLLLQAREATIARFRPILTAHGLTEQQWRVIRALLDEGPLEPRQIGALSCISSPSLAGVLARMDSLGLVRRNRMSHDQRRVTVELTAKSRQLARKLRPEIEVVYRAMEAQAGGETISRLYATLDDLLRQLEQIDNPEAVGD